jgi:hypothetical protein
MDKHRNPKSPVPKPDLLGHPQNYQEFSSYTSIYTDIDTSDSLGPYQINYIGRPNQR